ncbi:hypothetical protein P2D06_19275, partial [Xanthomonas perforans]
MSPMSAPRPASDRHIVLRLPRHTLKIAGIAATQRSRRVAGRRHLALDRYRAIAASDRCVDRRGAASGTWR